MNTRSALRHTGLGLTVCLAAAACTTSLRQRSSADDADWLTRTLIGREAALSRTYNTCHLHALRDTILAGTLVRMPDGRRLDPVREARDRICGHRHRQTVPGSLIVRAVGYNSALVTGTQRFCAIGVTPCTGPGAQFAHLWTLANGQWRLDWIRRYPMNAPIRIPGRSPE